MVSVSYNLGSMWHVVHIGPDEQDAQELAYRAAQWIRESGVRGGVRLWVFGRGCVWCDGYPGLGWEA